MDNVKDELVSIGIATQLLGVCKTTLREWDKNGKFKPAKTIGKHRRYRVSDINRMLEVSCGGLEEE